MIHDRSVSHLKNWNFLASQILGKAFILLKSYVFVHLWSAKQKMIFQVCSFSYLLCILRNLRLDESIHYVQSKEWVCLEKETKKNLFIFTIHSCLIFFQSGMQLYWHILENLQLPSNRADNFEAIYCTMGLLCLEVGQDEVITELLRLGLDIQVWYNLQILVFSISSLAKNVREKSQDVEAK